MLNRIICMPLLAALIATVSASTNAAPARNASKPELVLQSGQSEDIRSFAVSSDGRFLLTGSADRTLMLWDMATGKELRSFHGHTARVDAVAFSRDGRVVLSGSSSGEMKLWDAASGRELRSFFSHPEKIHAVALSPDGGLAVSGSCSMEDNDVCQQGAMRLWDVTSGQKLRDFTDFTDSVNTLEFSRDGRLLLSGSSDALVRLWNVAARREIRRYKGHKEGANSTVFSSNGRFILSGGGHYRAPEMMMWDTATARRVRRFVGHTECIRSIALSRDGRRALSTDVMGTVKVWNVATGKELHSFEGGSPIKFLPHSRHAISKHDSKLTIWDVTSGKELRHIARPARDAKFLAVSPASSSVVALTGDLIRFWDVGTGKLLRTVARHPQTKLVVTISPDARYAVGSTSGHTTIVWDLATGAEVLHAPDLIGHPVFSPDGRFVLTEAASENGSGLAGGVKLWDLVAKKELRRFAGHSGFTLALAFSPDGRLALSGGSDHTVKLWDIESGKELQRFDHSSSVEVLAFLPGGSSFLAGGDGDDTAELKLWDIATGAEIRSFTGHTSGITSLAITPDGRLALTGSNDGTVRVWDVATGKELHVFTGHTGGVYSVALLPGGRFAMSSGKDGTTRKWDLEKRRELARMVVAEDGEWLTMTPQGFYSASRRDTELLAIVRGMEVMPVGQAHKLLFNPDLVREALAGDLDGKVENAAKSVSLEDTLAAGPSPTVAITSHEPDSRATQDQVTVRDRISDRGSATSISEDCPR